MYKQEVPAIVEWLKNEGSGGLVTTGAFVLCTIQTPISRVGIQMDCIREHGIYSPSLWGFKATGYYHLSSHKEELHSLLTNHDLPREDVFYRVMDTPGLGLAKTGFLMQLYGWETACIDMHNAKRFNIPVPRCPSTLKTDTKMKKIIEYLIMCDQIGGSEYLWDQWCEYVAGNRMNKNLPTAEAVSLYHKECICG